MKCLTLVLSLFLLFGCKSGIEEISPDVDSPDNTRQLFNFSGRVIDGPCLAGANVEIKMLRVNTLAQTQEIYLTTTGDFGYFDVNAEIDKVNTPFALVKVTNAECHNEVTGLMMPAKTYYAMIEIDSSVGRNIHPQTTGVIARTEYLYKDNLSATFRNFEQSQIQAETEWMSMYGITGITTRFGDMRIDNSSNGSAALLAMNAIHLYGNNEAEQAQLIEQLSSDLTTDGTLNSTDLISKIKNSSKNVSIVSVSTNLKNRFVELGVEPIHPNFWDYLDSDGDGILNANDPDSYIEIFSRNPILKYENNLSLSTTQINAGVSSLKYATPKVFSNAILGSNYYGTSLDGDSLEFYTVKSSNNCNLNGGGYPAGNVIACLLPDQKVFTAKKLKENYFGTSLKNEYNETVSGLPSTSVWNISGNNLTAGTQYYIIMSKQTPYLMSKYSSSIGLPFGNMLMYDEGCVVSTDICTENWFGYNNTSTMFTKDGEKYFLTD